MSEAARRQRAAHPHPDRPLLEQLDDEQQPDGVEAVHDQNPDRHPPPELATVEAHRQASCDRCGDPWKDRTHETETTNAVAVDESLHAPTSTHPAMSRAKARLMRAIHRMRARRLR